MNVPFLDLKRQHDSIRTQLNQAIAEVIDSCAFAGGPFVEKFEKEFAAFCSCRHALAVGNGTDALWLIMRALGIGPGDEVITVPNTFIATAEAISLCGATPVLADVDPHTYTMDPSVLKSAITSRTKAIIPVHLFGQTADMDPIRAVADAAGVPVIEDACQAHGAEYKGRRAGSLARAAAFSFYPGKNLGACGEGGAITTDDPDIAEKARMIRDHGQSRKYIHKVVGWNARMDGIQGAILSVKLTRLNAWNDCRRNAAEMYRKLLSGLPGVTLPVEAKYARHIYHVFAVRVRGRDRLLKELSERGIHCAIHYPVPIHLQEAYKDLGFPAGSFPTAEKCAEEYLSLPMYPELTMEQASFVAENLRALLSSPHAS